MYYYQPLQKNNINESLVGSKYKNPIRQYLPNKHTLDSGKKFPC